MTIRYLLAATVALTAGGLSRATLPADTIAQAPALHGGAFATSPRAAWQADDPADSLYRAAREALNRGDFRVAARTFAQISEKYPTSTYAADALYWEAYSHYSIGEPGELRAALRALDEAGVETIAVMPIPAHGLGEAINDRLKRASSPATIPVSAELP